MGEWFERQIRVSKINYKSAGVDIDAGNEAVDRIKDKVESNNVTDILIEDELVDNIDTFLNSIDDFNKNYSSTLTSPFQESVFTDQNAIAKVPNNPNLINFDDIFYQSKRSYFGPVNIKKIHVRLLDELGRVVDLNNNDFSFSIQLEQLYDVHANKIFN